MDEMKAGDTTRQLPSPICKPEEHVLLCCEKMIEAHQQ